MTIAAAATTPATRPVTPTASAPQRPASTPAPGLMEAFKWLRFNDATLQKDAPPAKGSKTASELIEQALTQVGADYVWGAKPGKDNAKPQGFDCSGLVYWAAARAGLSLRQGSMEQYDRTEQIPVAQALKTRGALVFYRGSPNHVAISLGDGRVLEASFPWGVRVSTDVAKFTMGGLIKGLALR